MVVYTTFILIITLSKLSILFLPMVAETSQVVNFSGKVQSAGPNIPFFFAVNNSNKVQDLEKPPIMFYGKSGKHLCRICTETIDILPKMSNGNTFFIYTLS